MSYSLTETAADPTALRPTAPPPGGSDTEGRPETDQAEPGASVSRAGLAKLAGLSRAAITRAARAALAPAVVGARIDVTHPAAAAFLARHGVAAADVARLAAIERAEQARNRSLPAPLLRLTLQQLIETYDQQSADNTVTVARVIRVLRRMQTQLGTLEDADT